MAGAFLCLRGRLTAMTRSPWLALPLALALVGCTAPEDDNTIPEASVTVLEPSTAAPADTPSPTHADTWTLTDTGTAIFVPPAPEPPAYDPCAIDPITGNVQDGDCFGGTPVE